MKRNRRAILTAIACVILAAVTFFGIGAVLLVWNSRADDSGSSSSPPSPGASTPTPPSANEEPVTKTGTLVCLPHKNTDGPQTLECAMGLKDTSGTYYALRDTSADYSILGGLPYNDATIEVTGTLKPEASTTYQSIGIISVTAAKKL